jgi:peptide/nickel transport system substrate-binding protein
MASTKGEAVMIKRVAIVFGFILALGCCFIAQPVCFAQTVVIAMESPPTSMDPHSENDNPTMGILSNVFDGLMQREKTEGKDVPALAERYEHPDPLTWKFNLRKGVKFHNGNPFTAADVKYTFERLRNPEVSEYVYTGDTIASIETPDDFTVVVKTKYPAPWFIGILHRIFIMNKESTESRPKGEIETAPIGTGAYKAVEFDKGSHLKLEANPDYWEGEPPIKTVEMKFISDLADRFVALVGGSAELLNSLPVEGIDLAKQDKAVDLQSHPGRTAIYLVVSNRPGTPTADVRVRKAMYMAINEDEIIKKVLLGQASAAAQMLDPLTLGYNPDITRLPYNPQEASRLLKEAGFEKGFEITLAGPSDRYVMGVQICEAVAKDLAKVGIKVKLDIKPKAVFLTEVRENKQDFYLGGWLEGTYSGARTFFRYVHTIDKEKGYGGWNGSQSSDKDIDELLEKTLQITNEAEYAKTLQEANKMIMERIRLIPLHYEMDLYAVRKNSGIQFTPRPDQWIVLKEISKH